VQKFWISGKFAAILASASVLPPPLDVPIILFNENIMFGHWKNAESNRHQRLGAGYAYPAKGWETYAMRENNTRYLLSALYRDTYLFASTITLQSEQRSGTRGAQFR